MKLNLTIIFNQKIYKYMSTHIAMWLERFKILHIMGFGSFELEWMGRMGWVIPLRLLRPLEHLHSPKKYEFIFDAILGLLF